MSAGRGDEPAAPRLLLVDDHPAVRQGLALLVASEGMAVAAEAAGRAEALAGLARQAIDLAVVDLTLEGEDGLDLVGELARRRVPVLVYSMHADAAHVEGAFAAGALGYVTKAEFRGVLIEALRTVAAGRRYVSPKAGLALADGLAAGRAPHPLVGLSAQEREVHRRIGQGDGIHATAVAMGLSPHTVESYCARIQTKLGLAGMHELHHHAIAHYRGGAG